MNAFLMYIHLLQANCILTADMYRIFSLLNYYPTQFKTVSYILLHLHYVPGSNGSHGSPKHRSPWHFGHFCSSFATSRYVLSRSIKVSVTDRVCWIPGSPRRTTFSSIACHGRLYVSSRLATFCWTSHVYLRFDQVLPRPSSSVKVSYDETWTMGDVCADGMKKRSKTCCKHSFLNL